MAKFLYKEVKSATTSKQVVYLHKSWTITDETSGSHGVYEYKGQYSNGTWNISDAKDNNIAKEETTVGSPSVYYKREIFDSAYHVYYTDPESVVEDGFA